MRAAEQQVCQGRDQARRQQTGTNRRVASNVRRVHDKATVVCKHTLNFGKKAGGLTDVFNHHIRRDEVERPIGERETLDIAVHSGGKSVVPRQRLPIEIDAHDVPVFQA